ncbi:MAG: hypothetical protein II769_01040 [Oscillospiraceae bacterium]|nr:hypothetical protein [Oscillospiraceae bacterium]
MKKICLLMAAIGLGFVLLLTLTACERNVMKIDNDSPEHKVIINITFKENMVFSRYNVVLLVDENKVGTLEHGKNDSFTLYLHEGTHSVVFAKEADSGVVGKAKLVVNGPCIAEYAISCTHAKIDVSNYGTNKLEETELEETELEETELEETTMTIKEETQPVETDETTQQQTEPSTEPVTDSPTEPANDPTTEAPEESKDYEVYYSSNSKETVKNGNSGMYAYKGERSSVCYLIDIDEGYVYRFMDVDFDSTCDRVKIQSGDLNSVLITTYHDGDSVFSEGFHFKWKNMPDHMILQDSDGFEWDFIPMSLEYALQIRATKSIRDY